MILLYLKYIIGIILFLVALFIGSFVFIDLSYDYKRIIKAKNNKASNKKIQVEYRYKSKPVN